MPDRNWLRKRYRNQPMDLRTVLINSRLVSDVRVVERYLRKYPNNYTLHSTLAGLLWKSGRRQEALRMWRKIVCMFPAATGPFFQRANWEIETKNYQEAQNQLRLCLRKDKGYFRESAYLWRAECLFRLGRYRASISQLKYVSDIDENHYFPGCGFRSKSELMKDIECALFSRHKERKKTAENGK